MKDLLLDNTDLFIKDNLEWILAGKLKDKFSKEQLDTMLELSFLYNHIQVGEDKVSILFEYNGLKVNFKNVLSQYNDLAYMIGKEGVKNTIISTIKSSDDFQSAFRSFLRDNKINKIID